MTARTWRGGEVGGPGRGLGVDSFSTGLEDSAEKRGMGVAEEKKQGRKREGGKGLKDVSCV